MHLPWPAKKKPSRLSQKAVFSDEIVPLTVTVGRKEVLFDQDEYPRETNLEKLASLRPSFKKDGTVTAGNASGINDGCAILVLMSQEKAVELGIPVLAYIEASANSGLDPNYMGLGPIEASKKLWQRFRKPPQTLTSLKSMRPSQPSPFSSDELGH